MEDFDEDDFFKKRSPDYAKVEADRQAVTDHCAREHDKLKEKKKEFLKEKNDRAQAGDELNNDINKLLGELEEQVKQIKREEKEKTELFTYYLLK
ncbi:unnamed protein product [Rotaria sp. Silwood1]|nr:unnamed protein product [Rotaria sp. Silwood1]